MQCTHVEYDVAEVFVLAHHAERGEYQLGVTLVMELEGRGGGEPLRIPVRRYRGDHRVEQVVLVLPGNVKVAAQRLGMANARS